MPAASPRARQLRLDALLLLDGAGWDPRDIAVVVHKSVSTVLRTLKRRSWELRLREAPAPGSTCNHQEAGVYCDAPARPGGVWCAEHWRAGWRQ